MDASLRGWLERGVLSSSCSSPDPLVDLAPGARALVTDPLLPMSAALYFERPHPISDNALELGFIRKAMREFPSKCICFSALGVSLSFKGAESLESGEGPAEALHLAVDPHAASALLRPADTLTDEVGALASAAVSFRRDPCFFLEAPFSFFGEECPTGGWETPVPLGRVLGSERPQLLIREMAGRTLLPTQSFLQLPREPEVDPHVVGAADGLDATKLAAEVWGRNEPVEYASVLLGGLLWGLALICRLCPGISQCLGSPIPVAADDPWDLPQFPEELLKLLNHASISGVGINLGTVSPIATDHVDPGGASPSNDGVGASAEGLAFHDDAGFADQYRSASTSPAGFGFVGAVPNTMPVVLVAQVLNALKFWSEKTVLLEEENITLCLESEFNGLPAPSHIEGQDGVVEVAAKVFDNSLGPFGVGCGGAVCARLGIPWCLRHILMLLGSLVRVSSSRFGLTPNVVVLVVWCVNIVVTSTDVMVEEVPGLSRILGREAIGCAMMVVDPNLHIPFLGSNSNMKGVPIMSFGFPILEEMPQLFS